MKEIYKEVLEYSLPGVSVVQATFEFEFFLSELAQVGRIPGRIGLEKSW